MSLMPPTPPRRRHKFEGSSSRVFVTRQKEVPDKFNPNKNYTPALTITGFYTANGKDIYTTSSGTRDATIVDAYYAISPEVQRGGKRKTRRSRSRKRKSKSRKNRRKTSNRRKKTSRRR